MSISSEDEFKGCCTFIRYLKPCIDRLEKIYDCFSIIKQNTNTIQEHSSKEFDSQCIGVHLAIGTSLWWK